jgi:hypothetical protein
MPGTCALCLAAALGAGPASAQQVENLPATCTPLQEAVWNQIVTHQLGVSARDATADRRYIGPLANYKKGAGFRRGQLGGRNWFPADVVKRTLCGTLDRFELFYTSVSDHEADFHPFVEPAPPYDYLSSDVAFIADEPRTTYGEITLPNGPTGIWRNPPWFNLIDKRSLFGSTLVPSPRSEGGLAGSPFCMYGPWVFEDFHANQPEIHPAQQLWWRVKDSDEVRWLVAQDVSNRFSKEMWYCDVAGDTSDANCDGTRPADFVAWAPPSVSGEALVAYDLSATAPEERFLNVFLQRSDKPGPSGPAQQETRRFRVPGGVSQLTVTHPPNADSRMDATTGMAVGFQTKDECVTAAGDRILAYVAVRVVIDRGSAREGFAQVGFRHKSLRALPWPGENGSASPPTPPAIVETPDEALRYEQGRLVVDWSPPRDLRGRQLTLTTSAGEVGIERSSKGTFALPLRGGAEPIAARLDGRTFEFPKVRLEANFKSATSTAPDRARTELRVAYGSTRRLRGESLAESLNDRLSARHWKANGTLDLSWHHDRFDRVFGTAQCFDARLEATHTSEGGDSAEPIAVVDTDRCAPPGPADAVPVRVCASRRNLGCQWMPDERIVDVRIVARQGYRGLVTLTATPVDPFGVSAAPATRRVTFPYRPRSTLDRLIAEAAEEAGLTEPALRELGALSRAGYGPVGDELDLGTGICGARERRARLLVLFARYVAADGGGPADDKRMRDLARQLRETSPVDDPCEASMRTRARRR